MPPDLDAADATTVDAEDRPLQDAGIDSLMGIQLRNLLEGELGLPLPATLVWTYPTVRQIAVGSLPRFNAAIAAACLGVPRNSK